MKTTQNRPLEHLQDEMAILQTRLAQRDGILKEKDQHIKYLEEQLAWFKRQIFGKRSEKIVAANLNEVQLEFEGFECAPQNATEEKQPISAFERSKPKRTGKDKITLPSDLPVERVVLDLPEEEKTCSETGQKLVKIGEEVTHKLANNLSFGFVLIEIQRDF